MSKWLGLLWSQMTITDIYPYVTLGRAKTFFKVSFLLQWLAEHIPISLFETSTVCNAFNYRSIILTSINETLTLSNWLLCKLRFVSSCINNGFWIILSSHQPIISISRWRAHVQLQPHCTSDPLLLAFTSQDNLCSHDQIYSKPPTPRGSWEILQGLLRVTPAPSLSVQHQPFIFK